MTSKEYEYIIEQQKEIIEQQKDLIDKLLVKVNEGNKIIVPIENDRQVPNYPYPYYISPITCSNAASTDTKYTCIAPKDANCNKECDSCCYHAKLC